MSGKNFLEVLKHLKFLSLSIPVGVLVVSLVFPLQPVFQQALVGILLVWVGVEAMTGFSFWS